MRSRAAAMNLEKLKLFRHYYVMVRHSSLLTSTIRSLLKGGQLKAVSLSSDRVLYLLHADHRDTAEAHGAVPVAVGSGGNHTNPASASQNNINQIRVFIFPLLVFAVFSGGFYSDLLRLDWIQVPSGIE